MEQNPAALWTCLLGAGLILVLPPAAGVTTHPPRPPQLQSCVFQERANITCHWKPGDPQTTHYTLQIQKTTRAEPFICTTTNTSCTVEIGTSTVRREFCINITAHGRSGDVTSGSRCQSGRIEIKLRDVRLKNVAAVAGDATCLNVSWSREPDFPVAPTEIQGGDLESQIELKEHGQPGVEVKNVTVTDFSFTVCLLRPSTSYTLRLRHRFQSSKSPWSPWSNACHGSTGEGVPSSGPPFWRRVKETDEYGRRLISLLWKPLPHFLANGEVLFYKVTCQMEGGQVLTDNGSCRDLNSSRTSCSLRLPPGRCSCALTASNSAGTSPEARIWVRGAAEAEPPSLRQITASALDYHHLKVRWAAPADPPLTGFVVEWFAVKEKTASVVRWERLNSSRRTLVISEGVEPLMRYAVSVRALYVEGGAGQNSTHLIYTRQGVPSAGPQVQVQKISGNTVEFSWTPVPVEELHGFIRNYTVYYATANRTVRREFVPGNVRRHSLLNLPPGHYDIFVQANTDAGAGKNGTSVNVHIGSEEIPVVMCVVSVLVLTSLALLLLTACLAQNKMVKHKLCQDIPDPSNSSLAHWMLKPALESMKWTAAPEKSEIKYSEVVLLSESELHNSATDQDFGYKTICNLQPYSFQQYSQLPASESVQSHQNTRRSNKKYMRSQTRGSGADVSSCPSIYTNVLYSQILPSSVLSPLCHQPRDRQCGSVCVHDPKLPLEGDVELRASPQARSSGRGRGSGSPLSQTDGLETRRHLQGALSFPDFFSVSHPSALLSHPADTASPKHLFAQNHFRPVQLLQGDTHTHPESPPFFIQPFFADFSHCPMECDPYIAA